MKTMRDIKYLKSILLIISVMLFTSCTKNSSMKPEDFKDKEPKLIIEEYLSGNVKAWGVLQNRSGKVTRQFSADLNGKWDGKQLILDEKFNWDDGEIQTRQWQITKLMIIIMRVQQETLLEKQKDILMGQHLSLSMFFQFLLKARK